MAEMKQEAQQGTAQALRGASYVVTGDISEFARRDVGDKQLFGLLGCGKTQVAYAKITLKVVDIKTSAVVYSARGAGEFELSNREVLGLAIREAVDARATARDASRWGSVK